MQQLYSSKRVISLVGGGGQGGGGHVGFGVCKHVHSSVFNIHIVFCAHLKAEECCMDVARKDNKNVMKLK